MKKSTCKIKYLKFSMRLRPGKKSLPTTKVKPSNPSTVSQIPSTIPTETELRESLFQLLTGKIKLLFFRLYRKIRQWLGWKLLNESSQP